mgnify:CR=1 FL=1
MECDILMVQMRLPFDWGAMSDALKRASEARTLAIKNTPAERRSHYGQHLTPPEVARLAVSLFSNTDTPPRCLDLGAGTGMLSVALAHRYNYQISHIDAIELDKKLAQVLTDELNSCGMSCDVLICDALDRKSVV